jgi:hypothetical protein
MGAGAWMAKKVAAAKIGEQLGFGVSPAGLHAVAYYDEDMLRLRYVESADGLTWSAPSDVDTDGNTGQHPSLAFDAAGEPAIAYYRCNDYDPRDRNCNQDKDGLYLARRAAGKWIVRKVQAQGGVFDGLYSAVGFVGGKAVIAFQERSFDASSATSIVSLRVGREP